MALAWQMHRLLVKPFVLF